MPALSREKKKIWAGLIRPISEESPVSDDTDRFRRGTGDFPDFQNDLEGGQGGSWDPDGDGSPDSVDSYSEYEDYLVKNGYTPSEASAITTDAKNRYSSFDEYKDYLTNDDLSNTDGSYGGDSSVDSWSEYRDYLVNNGYSGSEADSTIADQQAEYGSDQAGFDSFKSDYEQNGQGYDVASGAGSNGSYKWADGGDYEQFQDRVSDASSWSEYKQDLLDKGWSQEEADKHVAKAQQRYGSDQAGYDAYQQTVDGKDSYADYESDFGTTPGIGSDVKGEDGQPTAGIRVHEQPGTTFDGENVPSGTAEIYGQEIHTSQRGPPTTPTRSPNDPAAPEDPGDIATFQNMSIEPANPVYPQQIRVECEVVLGEQYTAGGAIPQGELTVTGSLIVDDEVIRSKTVRGPVGSVRRMRFTLFRDKMVCHSVTIEDIVPAKICWLPARTGKLGGV